MISVGILQKIRLLVLTGALILVAINPMHRGGVQAWTYTYSKGSNLQWQEARQWCQEHFTDMVSIKNKEEAEYLDSFLPYNPSYYWIGVQKVAEKWIWVETNKPIPVEAQDWALEEPDTIDGQDCVELYIKRDQDSAKWNNEKCSRQKEATCYTASCTQESCNAYGECEETVGNFTCKCLPGFQGLHCKEAVACEALAEPRQSSYRCVHPNGPNRFNSSCRFYCEVGFRLVGVSQLACQADGQWNHPVPQCEVEHCPALNQTDFRGGTLNCSHPISTFSYNSSCEFFCDDGYQLVGQKRIWCDHTGQWAARTPACSVRKCSAAVAPPGVNMVCVDPVEPFSFGSQCDFTCEEGHDLLGNSSVSCLASGEWSSPTPRCAAVQCHNLSPPLHGSVHCRDPLGQHSYGSVCSVQCEDGFKLVGTNLTKCSAQGNWSHELPVCQAKLCQTVTSPSHGVLSCFHPNGPFSFASACSITCDEGFIINGTSTVECSSLGMWSTDIPTCMAVHCGTLQHMSSRVSMNCSHPLANFSLGSECIFTCKDGFSLNGSTVLVCSSSGSWSDQIPTCTALTCPPLSFVSHGSTLCSDPYERSSFGSRCTTACEDGFLLNGTAETECTSAGMWTSDVPFCSVKTCTALRSPAHGSLNCSEPHGKFSFASRCTLTCGEGFVLNGTAVIECSSQGTWSTEPPECLAKTCPPVRSPAHGSLVCSDPHGEFSFGSRCTSTCERGHLLTGAETTECTSAGRWSNDTPLCRVQQCPHLVKAPQHGRMNCSLLNPPFSYGSRCDYDCSEGFRLKGAATVTCDHSGRWSQDVPTCQPVHCGTLQHMSSRLSMNCSHPLANFSLGSECIFTCKDGFSLNGSTVLVCSSSGSWSDQIPTCTGSSLGMMILQYAGYGAACAALVLILFGLTDLMIRHLKKGGRAMKAEDLWADTVNPTFEL